MRWGDRDQLAGLFGDAVDLVAPERTFDFRFASAEQHADYLCTEYPPLVVALSRIDHQRAADLRREIVELADEMNVSDGDGLVLPLAYLEVVARKR